MGASFSVTMKMLNCNSKRGLINLEVVDFEPHTLKNSMRYLKLDYK